MDEVTSCYANVQELRDTGMTGLASLVSAVGVPLEIIGMVNNRVALITQLDYEEGGLKPLVKRERMWSDSLTEALKHQAAGRTLVCQSIAIYPDSTHEVLPRWWRPSSEPNCGFDVLGIASH